VTFLPLDLTNPNSIQNVLGHIDYAMQYGEDEEPKEVGASLVPSPFPATLPGLMGGQAWIASDSFMERHVKLTISLSIHFFVGFITAILIAPPTHPLLLTPPSPRFFHCMPPHLPTGRLSWGCVNDDPKLIYSQPFRHSL
jgi:hypothetical protein